jgi:hypothetical protein
LLVIAAFVVIKLSVVALFHIACVFDFNELFVLYSEVEISSFSIIPHHISASSSTLSYVKLLALFTSKLYAKSPNALLSSKYVYLVGTFNVPVKILVQNHIKNNIKKLTTAYQYQVR